MTRQLRGRPPKFGRPARLVALTLPDDVLDWLRTIHTDPAWAIVKLAEQQAAGLPQHFRETESPAAELVQLPGRRALFVVTPSYLRHLQGVSTIPLADGRAFLALESGQGIADLEIAILDRMETASLPAAERRKLEKLRNLFRDWRRTPGLSFRSRSIIVVETTPATSRPDRLAPLKRQRAVAAHLPSRRRS